MRRFHVKYLQEMSAEAIRRADYTFKESNVSFSSVSVIYFNSCAGHILHMHCLVFAGHPETFPLCDCYWKARLLVAFANCLSTSLFSLETAAGSCQPAIDMQISAGSSSFSLCAHHLLGIDLFWILSESLTSLLDVLGCWGRHGLR